MKLAALFCDHAVLQREISVPVWGWMKPRAKVKVELGPYSALGLSGADGKFQLRLPPMPAGGPYMLKATELTSGEQISCKDVMIGEVWLASGQSNMEWTLASIGQAGEDEIASQHPDTIRMINIPHIALAGRQSDVEAIWQTAKTGDLATFSAVAFYFARQLQEKLGVTVGIVNSSWGGTLIEAWTSRETLMRNPATAPWLLRYESDVNSPEFWQPFEGLDLFNPIARTPQGKHYPTDPGQADGTGWTKLECDDRSWESMKLPGSWQSRGLKFSAVMRYRKIVDIPSAWVGKDLMLEIGAVDKQDITYFNGEQVGATGTGLEEIYWNQTRYYTIPGHLVKAGRNVIAVRAYSFAYDGGLIGPANHMRIFPTDESGTPISLVGNWQYQVEHNFGLITPASGKLSAGPGSPHTPGILYDNMIAPLLPYALRGAIWYQGESNADNAAQYGRMLKDMIRDWHFAWGQGDFPFLTVQLANFRSPENYEETSTWAVIREAQMQSLAEPNAGMAVIIDIGEECNIHPQNKSDVGLRLAQWALAETYHKPVVPSGPLYSGMTVEGNKIRLRFDHVGGGLKAKGGALQTFVIAGLDRDFKPATAEIDGATIVVSSPAVDAPMAVRYAWADNPAGCNLYNAEGLPASPFRTDVW